MSGWGWGPALTTDVTFSLKIISVSVVSVGAETGEGTDSTIDVIGQPHERVPAPSPQGTFRVKKLPSAEQLVVGVWRTWDMLGLKEVQGTLTAPVNHVRRASGMVSLLSDVRYLRSSQFISRRSSSVWEAHESVHLQAPGEITHFRHGPVQQPPQQCKSW